MDGGLIAGDAGGFLNSMRLKGIHLAMRTGMLAAEAAFEAIRAGDTSAATPQALSGQDRRRAGARRALSRAQRASGVRLRAVRRPGVRRAGAADARTMVREPARAAGPQAHEDAGVVLRAGRAGIPDRATRRRSIGQLTFDKVTNVHYSGTRARGGSAVAPARARPRSARRSAGPSTATRACASARRTSTRSSASAGGRAPADQRVELRALQDVRHHGSVSGDHLGAA